MDFSRPFISTIIYFIILTKVVNNNYFYLLTFQDSINSINKLNLLGYNKVQ